MAEEDIGQYLAMTFGSEAVGELLKLGEFAVEEGKKTGDDLLEASLRWLRKNGFMSKRGRYSYAAKKIANGEESLTIRVFKGDTNIAYVFQPVPESRREDDHLIEAFVLVPAAPTSLEDQGPGYIPEKRGGPVVPGDDKRY